MDDIALELEATKGLLYYHFKTKEDLLREILARNELTAGFRTILDGLAELRSSRPRSWSSAGASRDSSRPIAS